MNIRVIVPTLLLASAVLSCSSSRHADAPSADAAPIVPVKGPSAPSFGGKRAINFAVIYKTDGDYNQYVTANFDRSTGSFVSYPDPSDVTTNNEPLPLADGWLLDRRGGTGMNTVFLNWTYEDYHRLQKVPTQAELKAAIIAGAHVTEVRRLDITSYAAQRDTAAVNRIIRSTEQQKR